MAFLSYNCHLLGPIILSPKIWLENIAWNHHLEPHVSTFKSSKQQWPGCLLFIKYHKKTPSWSLPFPQLIVQCGNSLPVQLGKWGWDGGGDEEGELASNICFINLSVEVDGRGMHCGHHEREISKHDCPGQMGMAMISFHFEIYCQKTPTWSLTFP